MNKIDKLDKELEKAREKAAEWQAKIRELEKIMSPGFASEGEMIAVSQSFIDSNSETYRIGLMCSNDLRI